MVDYDPFSEDVIRDPHPTYARLRDESPCHHVAKWDCWALSRFEDIWQASMDADSYTTTLGTTSSHLLTKVQPVTPMINLMDPPQHTLLRSRIARFFTPGVVGRLEDQIKGFVDAAALSIEAHRYVANLRMGSHPFAYRALLVDEMQDLGSLELEIVRALAPAAQDGLLPVSYTHLTLPTICSV